MLLWPISSPQMTRMFGFICWPLASLALIATNTQAANAPCSLFEFLIRLLSRADLASDPVTEKVRRHFIGRMPLWGVKVEDICCHGEPRRNLLMFH